MEKVIKDISSKKQNLETYIDIILKYLFYRICITQKMNLLFKSMHDLYHCFNITSLLNSLTQIKHTILVQNLLY